MWIDQPWSGERMISALIAVAVMLGAWLALSIIFGALIARWMRMQRLPRAYSEARRMHERERP